MKNVLLVLFFFCCITTLDAQKKDYEKYLQSGKSKFDNKDYSGALVDFTMAIEARSKEPEAYYQRGYAHYYLYNDEKAIEDYTRAIEVDDKYEKAYFERGYLLLSAKKYEEAIPDFEKVLAIRKDDKLSHYNIGLCKYYLEDYVGSLTAYTKALQIDPEYTSALYNRSLAKYALKDYNGTIQDDTRVIELDPTYANAWYNRGLSYYNLAQYEPAIADFDKMLELDPEYKNAWYYRGLSHYYLGQYEASIRDFDAVIGKDPTYENALYNRGLARHYSKDYQGAVKDFEKVTELNPQDHEAFYRKGLSHYYLEDIQSSEQSYQQCLSINPDHEFAKRELSLLAENKPTQTSASRVKEQSEMARKDRRMPQIWAVIVGVSTYQESDLNLGYADEDAKSIYDFFISPSGGGLSSDNIVLLTNEEATRSNIIKALTDKFYQAFETDMVIFFIASHGQPDPVGNEVYFLGYDTQKDNLGGTGVSQIDIEKIFSRSRARKKIWIADACHSGGAGLSTSGVRGAAESAIINKLLFGMALASDGMAMLTASSSSEFSYENAKWGGGHGVFSHYLLEGLGGKADFDKNGLVEIRELYEFVYRNVSHDTQGKQHPELKGNFDNKLPMSVVR